MKSISNAIAILLMMGLLLGLGWVAYITITFLISQFGVVDPQMSAILTISSVTFLLSAIILAASIKTLAKKTDYNHHQKLELYNKLVDTLQNRNRENFNSLEELKNHLMIWASDSILEEFGTYLELVTSKDLNPDDLREQAQNLIIAIRKDVRNDHSTLDSTIITKLLAK